MNMETIFNKLVEEATDIQFRYQADPLDVGGVVLDMQLQCKDRPVTIFVSQSVISPTKGHPPPQRWRMVFFDLMKTLSQRLKEAKEEIN